MVDRKSVLTLAAKGAVGARAGLVVRIRPATYFERVTWRDCPDDGLRILIDEDGTENQNLELSMELPEAVFVSLAEWQKLLRSALRKKRE